MIVVNTEERAMPLESVEEDRDIDIWSMCIRASTGAVIVETLKRKKVDMYLEEGGTVERLLLQQLHKSEPETKGLRLPELYLDGLRVGGEKLVADMFREKTLIPALERAGAFELPPGAPQCRQQSYTHDGYKVESSSGTDSDSSSSGDDDTGRPDADDDSEMHTSKGTVYKHDGYTVSENGG